MIFMTGSVHDFSLTSTFHSAHALCFCILIFVCLIAPQSSKGRELDKDKQVTSGSIIRHLVEFFDDWNSVKNCKASILRSNVYDPPWNTNIDATLNRLIGC